MIRLTLLVLVITALAAPGAAAQAGPDRNVVKSEPFPAEAYYSSYGEPDPLPAVAPAPVVTDDAGPSWFGAGAIGAGLILLAGGIGAYAGRTVRPRGVA